LTGLYGHPNLTTLTIYSDNFWHLSSISDLPNLTELQINASLFANSIGRLSGLPNLTSLIITEADYKLDLSRLTSYTSLKSLWVQGAEWSGTHIHRELLEQALPNTAISLSYDPPKH
jgi:Leucine-rich repeat (LRR) protein